MKYYVYELIDSKDSKPFYVGKGSGLRYSKHISLARHHKHYNKHLENKIWNIWNNNELVISRTVFESDNEEEVFIKENELIKKYGLENLCNLEIGDRHRFNGFKHSEETKKILKSKNIKRFNNPLERLKVSLGGINRFKNVEERNRISKLTKEGMTKEIRNKISKAKKGKRTIRYSKIECVCILCGNKRMLSPSHAKVRKFCSRKCYKEYKNENSISKK